MNRYDFLRKKTFAARANSRLKKIPNSVKRNQKFLSHSLSSFFTLKIFYFLNVQKCQNCQIRFTFAFYTTFFKLYESKCKISDTLKFLDTQEKCFNGKMLRKSRDSVVYIAFSVILINGILFISWN